MAEYINREKLLDELGESASHHAESGREYQLLLRDRNIVREQPTADVIERSEYEALQKENHELVIKYDNAMNRVTDGMEEISRLRSKIIDEIIEKSFISDIYNDRTDDEIIKLDDVVEILKRNIGD